MEKRWLTAILVMLIALHAAAAHEPHSSVRLNRDAFRYAEELINEGRFVNDKANSWRQQRPTSQQENEFIQSHGWVEYEKWHLAMEETYGMRTKARYKFPYGDFNLVHRSGLLAAKNRACQYGYEDVRTACEQLLRLVESKQRPNNR